MIALLFNIAFAQDLRVELVITDADVPTGTLTAPVVGFDVGATRVQTVGSGSGGGGAGRYEPAPLQIRRDVDGASATLLALSTGQTPLDAVQLDVYGPHPTLPATELLVQRVLLQHAYVADVEIAMRDSDTTVRQQIQVLAQCQTVESFLYDAGGTLIGSQTGTHDRAYNDFTCNFP